MGHGPWVIRAQAFSNDGACGGRVCVLILELGNVLLRVSAGFNDALCNACCFPRSLAQELLPVVERSHLH
jgi:hypothetical protein